jgi:hypothetical protein
MEIQTVHFDVELLLSNQIQLSMSDTNAETKPSSDKKKTGPRFQFDNLDPWIYIVSIVFSIIALWGFGHMVRTAVKSILHATNPDRYPESIMVGREILGSQTTSGIFLTCAGIVGIISALSFVIKNSFFRFLLSLLVFVFKYCL